MRYCLRCVYPENARPTIIFDEQGICSGCRVHESKMKLNWDDREKKLREILEYYKQKAKDEGNIYDCIIPVSGGKDSHYQVYLIKEVYGMNPLLVAYNHAFNTRIGIRNLGNLVKQFGCDLLRVTHNLESVKKISRYMLKKVGDLTWHYHAGIFTVPFQIAVKYKIPLVIYGEHGYAEDVGLVRIEDFPEFTKWTRDQYDMRGISIEDMINDEESGITKRDVAPLIFPSEEEIEKNEVRGIFLGNFIPWYANKQVKFLMEKYNFKIMRRKRDRTFSLYHKIDDHANDVHDYLKFLKYGYGRATDHASLEIRERRMTREEGIKLVLQYDHVRPKTLDVYLKFLEITEEQFHEWIDPLRDPAIWEKDGDKWIMKDNVGNHLNDPGVEEARLPLVPEEDRTFGKNNRHLYYSEDFEPQPPTDDEYLVRDVEDLIDEFVIL